MSPKRIFYLLYAYTGMVNIMIGLKIHHESINNMGVYNTNIFSHLIGVGFSYSDLPWLRH